ncbi:MAG: hypothetical protein C0402_08435 [Thermodesulfovibrio sp.]|nr:hypothetical protein [Thermodesulfovibrio sp.]
MHIHSTEDDFLIFTVAHQRFALPYHNLIRIIDVPRTTSMPGTPPYARGCINVEGAAVPLYDLRRRFGSQPLKEEVSAIVDNLRQRRQDHLNWIAKLKDSVYNGKDISVETNPHKCAFGQWYDTFKPDSLTLANYMQLFDRPHKQIHGLATTASTHIKAGRVDDAKNLIHSAEQGNLRQLLDLFDGAHEHIHQYTYEYAVILNHNNNKIALAVDRLDAFERFESITSDMPNLLKKNCGNYISDIGRRIVDSGVEDVFILHLNNMFDAQQPESQSVEGNNS